MPHIFASKAWSAALLSFVATTTITHRIQTGRLSLIRDGMTELIGTAMDSDGDPVAYQSLLFRPEDLTTEQRIGTN